MYESGMSIHCIKDRHGLRSRQLHALERERGQRATDPKCMFIMPADYYDSPFHPNGIRSWIDSRVIFFYKYIGLRKFIAGGISEAIGWEHHEQELKSPCVQEQASSPSRGIREERAIALL